MTDQPIQPQPKQKRRPILTFEDVDDLLCIGINLLLKLPWILLGVILALLAIYFLAPQYLMTDCGCGAAAQAARNCVASGDFNSTWCGWLK